MQDFSCKYLNHPCELRSTQKGGKKTPTQKFVAWFKSLFLISEKNFLTYWYLRSKGAVEMEITKHKASKYWYIIHPFSFIKFLWGCVTTTVFVFSMIFIPFRCSFLNCFMARYYTYVGRPTTAIHHGAVIQMGLAVISLVDLFGNFITGIYVHQTRQTILVPSKIFKKYLFPDFVIDLTTTLPMDYVIIQFFGMSTYASVPPYGLLLLQTYSMYRMIRFRYFFIKWYRMSTIHRSWSQVFRLASALLIFYIIFSWSICLNIVIPELLLWEKLYEDASVECWIESSNLLSSEIHNQYGIAIVNSFHSLLGVTTMWNSLYSTEDFIMAMFVMVICKMYALYFLIITLEAITASNALEVKIHLIRSQLKAYLMQKDYPESVKKRMSRFYLYRFQARYLSNTTILKLLTKSLRSEISLYTCQRFLKKSELFQSVPKKKLLRFLQRMNKEMFFPKDVIIQGNTFGECMYFICSGNVMVSTVSGKDICTLKDGEFFGEIALIIPDKRRIATVTALTMTELYKLEFSDFRKMTSTYPDVLARLEKYAMERYRVIDAVEERFDLSKKYGAD